MPASSHHGVPILIADAAKRQWVSPDPAGRTRYLLEILDFQLVRRIIQQ
jgi:hypothetical protein